MSGPQERVQRHIVEQLVDSVPGLPVLDALVPQLVEKLEDVLKIVDLLVPVQEIEVPKLAQEDGTPWRAVLREPRVAGQLVDVPVPQTAILAHGRDARGTRRC